MPNIQSVSNADSFPMTKKSIMPKKYVDHPDYTEYFYETSATTGKKVGVGIASTFIPGLGQCINKEWAKGIGMFAGNIALKVVSNKVSRPVGFIAGLALNIWSIVDAVKHAKSESVQIVPKQNGDIHPKVDYAA